jgi:polar amino acid transport system substrate-binding protein
MITAMSFRSVIASLVFLALSALPSAAENAKDVLAPTGRLRVGVYQGSPTSMVTDPKGGQIHGLTYDLGREFAKRLGVPVEYATFQRIADVIVAIKNDQVDFTLTNASPARAQDVDFRNVGCDCRRAHPGRQLGTGAYGACDPKGARRGDGYS